MNFLMLSFCSSVKYPLKIGKRGVTPNAFDQSSITLGSSIILVTLPLGFFTRI
jgi:hypothetical protein